MFQQRYGVRKTWITINGENIDVLKFHESFDVQEKIEYRNFWQRIRSLKKRDLLNVHSLNDGLTLNESEWITFYGGGRRQAFIYKGDAYPEQSGTHFASVTAFLRVVHRYDERNIIWSRIKNGWELDLAFTTPVTYATFRDSTIYKILRAKTREVYVGLTLGTIEQRWEFHVRAARRGSTTKLARAIREDDPSGFELTVLEEGIADLENLRQREAHWVKELNSLGPCGLNMAPPGGLGSPRGKRTAIDGEVFRSQAEAAQILSRRTGLARHVILSRIVDGLPLPSKARTHSKHPEAGSNLFRRWLALLKRHAGMVDPRWVESFDDFKTDVFPWGQKTSLARIDDVKKWGPGNFQWLSTQEKIERQHGKRLSVKGIEFPSLKAVAKHFSIGVSTLKDRINRQGMTVDEAIQKPLSVTSYRNRGDEITVDGQLFRSKRQAIMHIAKKRGLTEHQAKYLFNLGKYD